MAQSRRSELTRVRLLTEALDLFELQGYEETSAAEIAAAAGVSEMTFFRHFPTKDRVLLDDPYDEALISAVAARPAGEAPLRRVVNGLRQAWGEVPAPAVDLVRRRTRIVAATPALRAAAVRNTQRTEDAVTAQLVADGAVLLEARAATAAVLAALTAALLWWAEQDQTGVSQAIQAGLAVFDVSAQAAGSDGRGVDRRAL